MITREAAHQISLTCLAGLRDTFRDHAMAWYVHLLNGKRILPYIYEGNRSLERQQQLWNQGRTTSGKIITMAKPGDSYHNYGLAFDWVPLLPVEKPGGYYEAGWKAWELYGIGKEAAKTYGMRTLTWEEPHVESAEYKDIGQLKMLLPYRS